MLSETRSCDYGNGIEGLSGKLIFFSDCVWESATAPDVDVSQDPPQSQHGSQMVELEDQNPTPLSERIAEIK